MTQGSSTPEAKGRQNVASGPVARDGVGAAIAGSGTLRFQSRLPKTITEMVSPARSEMTAICQLAGTVETAVGEDGDPSEDVDWSCGEEPAGRASNVRW